MKHAKKEHIFDFSCLKGSTGFHYAALYADCQRELCTVMIAIPLEHKYCEASLSFSGLNNVNRAKADLLKTVSHEVPSDLYLCIVKITQYWSVDCTARDFVGQTIMAEHLDSPSGKKAENLPLDETMIMPESAPA